MTGDGEEEKNELLKHGPIDVFFDISPPQAWDSSHFRAGILALRPKGRVSLMGGQMQDVKIPIRKIMHENLTLKGTWMYTRSQVFELIKMVESGILPMKDGEGHQVRGSFGLEDWEKAFDLAAKTGGNGNVLLKP
jgi:threonine dehydrogenase-like Zn-dependent dehydrogenase